MIHFGTHVRPDQALAVQTLEIVHFGIVFGSANRVVIWFVDDDA